MFNWENIQLPKCFVTVEGCVRCESLVPCASSLSMQATPIHLSIRQSYHSLQAPLPLD